MTLLLITLFLLGQNHDNQYVEKIQPIHFPAVLIRVKNKVTVLSDTLNEFFGEKKYKSDIDTEDKKGRKHLPGPGGD